MSDRKAPLPPLQRLSVGVPRTGPNPLEVLDQDALLQIRNALIDVDAPHSVCEQWNLWCSVSKAAREHLDMCTNPDDGSWREACRLLGLLEKPVIPGEEAKTWRQWLRRLCAMASSIEAYGEIGYWWYRELCREVRTEKRFKTELPGMDPPHRWRLRCAGQLSHLNLRGEVAVDNSHYFLIDSLCLQFGDADALDATRVWGPKVDMMFFPKTDPNEPGFLEGKMERREYAIAAGANVSEVLYVGFPDTEPELNTQTGALQFGIQFGIGCWSDKEAWYVPDIESVRMLLDAGAVPSGNPERPVTESEYYTLLMHAAWAGDVALCELLLERGAFIDAIQIEASPRIGENATALAYAVQNASFGRGDAVGTLRTLLARNPVLTAFYEETTMLAFWAGWQRNFPAFLPEESARVVEAGRLLARHAGGVMLNQQDAQGNTALHMLNMTLTEGIDDVAVPMLRLLLDEGADVSLVNRLSATPLIDAVERGVDTGFDAMGLLIRASAEAGVLDVQNSVGDTALHLTHDNGNTDVMRLLLDAGADPNVPDNEGKTLLHHMAEEGITEYVRHEDVEALLNAGADPNLIDEQGWTPAHYAGEKGDKDMFRLLLEHGAEGVDKFDFFDEWTDDEDF